MTIKEAMKERHMVRKYVDKKIPEDLVSKLNERIEENNKKYDLSIKLMLDNDKAVNSIIKLLLAKGVKNYINDRTWNKNIEERNCRVLNGEGDSDYYLDEGLMRKLLSIWEAPSKNEIDVWYTLERT